MIEARAMSTSSVRRLRRVTRSEASPAALLAKLERGLRPRLLVVGDLVADRYVFGRTDRISREAPVLIVRREREEIRLGGAANAAWNAAALGAQVTALGVLGRDEMGRAVKKLCARFGVELQALSDAGICTESKTRILAGGQNTSRQQMLRLDQGQEGPLPAPLRARLAEAVEALAARADAVLVSDYGAGVLGPEAIGAVCQAARQIPVVVDSRYQLHLYRGATVAKPNEPELAAATSLPVGTAAQVARAAKVLARALGCPSVLCTRGRLGMTLLAGEKVTRFEAHGPLTAVDVTGAGDAVGAALATFLAAGGSTRAAAALANIAGGHVVQKLGTATSSVRELRAALEAG